MREVKRTRDGARSARAPIFRAALCLLTCGCLVSCNLFGGGDSGAAGETGGTAAAVAKAEISGTGADSTLTGTATFTETPEGVQIVVMLSGVSPGKHGVHLHESGSCDDSGKGAGGHFNPDGKQHGAPDAEEHHAGDFGNIVIGDDGTGKLELVSKDLTVAEGDHSVVNRAVIVHDKEDDFGQPTGNAGGRIGCGVVTE